MPSSSSRSLSGVRSSPLPLPLAVTVPEGHPRFRFSSLYPISRSIAASALKDAALLQRICGTTGMPAFCAGLMSNCSRRVKVMDLVGLMKGIKYLSTPPKCLRCTRRKMASVTPSMGAK